MLNMIQIIFRHHNKYYLSQKMVSLLLDNEKVEIFMINIWYMFVLFYNEHILFRTSISFILDEIELNDQMKRLAITCFHLM